MPHIKGKKSYLVYKKRMRVWKIHPHSWSFARNIHLVRDSYMANAFILYWLSNAFRRSHTEVEGLSIVGLHLRVRHKRSLLRTRKAQEGDYHDKIKKDVYVLCRIIVLSILNCILETFCCKDSEIFWNRQKFGRKNWLLTIDELTFS